MYFFLIVLFSLVFRFLILFLGNFFRKKYIYNLEKISPFECGFNPKFNARLPFTIRFFLISIIFLIFDVELVLIFPFLIKLNFIKFNYFLIIIIFFVFILFIGLIHEWNQGSLDWVVW